MFKQTEGAPSLCKPLKQNLDFFHRVGCAGRVKLVLHFGQRTGTGSGQLVPASGRCILSASGWPLLGVCCWGTQRLLYCWALRHSGPRQLAWARSTYEPGGWAAGQPRATSRHLNCPLPYKGSHKEAPTLGWRNPASGDPSHQALILILKVPKQWDFPGQEARAPASLGWREGDFSPQGTLCPIRRWGKVGLSERSRTS